MARDIWSLCNMDSVSFIHTPRSANCVADFFVKVGVQFPVVEIFTPTNL